MAFLSKLFLDPMNKDLIFTMLYLCISIKPVNIRNANTSRKKSTINATGY